MVCFFGSPLHRFLQCCATLLGLILQRGKGRSGGRSVRGSIPWKSWIEACQQKFSHCGKRQRAPDLRWIPSIVICNHDAIKVKLKPCCTAGFFITAISHRLSACVYWEEALASLKSASANNNAIRWRHSNTQHGEHSFDVSIRTSFSTISHFFFLHTISEFGAPLKNQLQFFQHFSLVQRCHSRIFGFSSQLLWSCQTSACVIWVFCNLTIQRAKL